MKFVRSFSICLFISNIIKHTTCLFLSSMHIPSNNNLPTHLFNSIYGWVCQSDIHTSTKPIYGWVCQSDKHASTIPMNNWSGSYFSSILPRISATFQQTLEAVAFSVTTRDAAVARSLNVLISHGVKFVNIGQCLTKPSLQNRAS